MKYIVYNAKTGIREYEASPAQVRDLLTPDQQLEAIEAKRQDPFEEVSFMTSGGRIVCEL